MFKKYFSSRRLCAKKANSAQLLNLESLEDRMMLSSVQIFAQGQTGDESMQLLINDQVVANWENIDTTTSSYFYQTEETIEPRDIKIEFTNDEYRPEDGYDRNLSVYSVVVDDASLSTAEPSTYSTGVYVEGSGITPGFWESSTLHASGYFSFLQDLQYDGYTWDTVGTGDFDVNPSGSLVITNRASEVTISRELNLVEDQTYTLDVNIDRLGNVGNQWATVGINFYDFFGNLIQYGTSQSQLQLEANEASNVQQFAFSPPDGATSAFLWLWVNGSDPNALPVIVNELDVNLAPDTTPPELAQNVILVSVPQFDDGVLEVRSVFRDLNLSIDGVSSNAFTIVRDDGLELDPYSLEARDFGLEFTGVDAKFAPEGGWTPDFNGQWSLRVNANSVVDGSGNAFPESLIEMEQFTFGSGPQTIESVSLEIYDPVTDNLGPREVFLDAYVSDFSATAFAYVRLVDPNGVNVGWIDEADFYLISPDGTVYSQARSVGTSVGEGSGDNRFITTTIFWDLDIVRDSNDRRPWQIGVNPGGVADLNGQTNIGGVITTFDPGD